MKRIMYPDSSQNEDLAFRACPLCEDTIDVYYCIEISLVFEGTSPERELPEWVKLTEGNRKICMNCPEHPD